jgi:hypothetical protein
MVQPIAALIALVVFLICLLTALGVVNAAHLLWWILAFLALAVLLGSTWFGGFLTTRKL